MSSGNVKLTEGTDAVGPTSLKVIGYHFTTVVGKLEGEGNALDAILLR